MTNFKFLIHPKLEKLFPRNSFTVQQIIKSMQEDGFNLSYPIKLGFLPEGNEPYSSTPFIVDGYTRYACSQVVGIELNTSHFEFPILYNTIEDAIWDAYQIQANRRNIAPISLALAYLDTLQASVEGKLIKNNRSIEEINSNLPEFVSEISGFGLTYTNQLLHLWRKHDEEYHWLKQNPDIVGWNLFYNCVKKFEKMGKSFDPNLCELSNWDAHRLEQILLTQEKFPELNIEQGTLLINGEQVPLEELSGEEIKEIRKEFHLQDDEKPYKRISIQKRKNLTYLEVVEVLESLMNLTLDKNGLFDLQLTQLVEME